MRKLSVSKPKDVYIHNFKQTYQYQYVNVIELTWSFLSSSMASKTAESRRVMLASTTSSSSVAVAPGDNSWLLLSTPGGASTDDDGPFEGGEANKSAVFTSSTLTRGWPPPSSG